MSTDQHNVRAISMNGLGGIGALRRRKCVAKTVWFLASRIWRVRSTFTRVLFGEIRATVWWDFKGINYALEGFGRSFNSVNGTFSVQHPLFMASNLVRALKHSIYYSLVLFFVLLHWMEFLNAFLLLSHGFHQKHLLPWNASSPIVCPLTSLFFARHQLSWVPLIIFQVFSPLLLLSTPFSNTAIIIKFCWRSCDRRW